MVEVDPSRYILTQFIAGIPAYAMIPSRGEAVHQPCDLPTHHIVNDETDRTVLRQVVGDRGRWVERVGVVVVQRELGRYGHDLMDRVTATDRFAILPNELIADVDRYIQFFLQVRNIDPYRSAITF